MPSANRVIRYGSSLHGKVIQALVARKDFSKDEMSQRHVKWRRDEETAQFYLKESDEDATKRVNRTNKGVLDYQTIVIPYSYAMLLSAHTMWSSVFLNRTPVHQYTGRHGEAEHNVQAVESLIDYQVTMGRHLAPYYFWLMDIGKYGLGVCGVYWDEEEHFVSKIEERPVTYLGIPIPGKFHKVKSTERLTGFKGNKVFNVRPYDFLPDPRKPMAQFQGGEFCGHMFDTSLEDLKEGEAAGRYFNTDKVAQQHVSQRVDKEEGSEQMLLPADGETSMWSYVGLDDLETKEGFQMTVSLIPKEWDLGEGTRLEKWTFTVIGDEFLIEARPHGAHHNRFPYITGEYEIEPYQLAKRSMLEITDDLNEGITWLVNSHFYNVRAALNNMFLYDPSKIESSDVKDPGPGKRMRLKPAAYGTDVRIAMAQFQTQDVTQNHLRDAQWIMQIMARLTGASENVQGSPNPGGRKTATEVRSTQGFSVGRLKTNAEFFSAGGFSELGFQLLANTQQYYDDNMKLRIAGDVWNAEGTIDVDPNAIAGGYDYVHVDGTMPIDRFAMANLWREVVKESSTNPLLAQRYDIGRIFEYMLQLGGLKNIKRFRIDVQSQGVVDQGAAGGNLIPMGGGNGRGRSAIAGAGEEGLSRVPEPGQVPGMGTTG